MFKHYFLLGLRNIRKNKKSFFINLIGLSTGLACALLIYLWVLDELNFDKFNKNDSQIFLVMQNIQMTGETSTLKVTPGPLAEALAEEMPEVEYAVSVFEIHLQGKPNLSVDDKKIKADCIFTGNDFFNIFSYGLIEGDPDQLFRDKNSIVISEDVALKLFDSKTNVTGKTLKYQHEEQKVITGVFNAVPSNSSMQFDFVLPDKILREKYPSVESWGNNQPSTYVLLRKGADITQFNDKIAGLIERKCGQTNRSLFLKPYSDNYLYGTYKNGIQVGGRIEYIRLFSIIAAFILVIACINFMNLSTARASGRGKEIMVKKALGAERKSLIFQYLAESFLTVFLSVIVAIILVGLFIPHFNEITGKHIAFKVSALHIIILLVITLITGLIAGSYPALLLSSLKPVAVLKGKFHGLKGELWIRKGLVIFQFILSAILIVFVLVVFKQIEYIRDKELGFDKENILYFDVEGKVADNPDTFLSEIKNIPGITDATSTAFNILGKHNITGNVNWEAKNQGDKVDFHMQMVNYDYIETLGIELKEGRSFSGDFGSEVSKVICNETAVSIMGLKDPIGKVINLSGEDKEIIGVTRDFHYESLYNRINPLLFVLASPSRNLKIMAKLRYGAEKETINRLEDFYEQYNPGYVFEYRYLDEDYQTQYNSERRLGVLSRYFAGLAVLISCLGLFGMAAFSTEKRTREIGIRKVFGSSAFRIVFLFTLDFTILVLVSLLFAIPISYLISKNWLNDFVYSIQLEWWYFVVSGLIALILAWITVGTLAIRISNIDPAQCLKEE